MSIKMKMKIFKYFIPVAVLFSATSCNMDLFPPDTIGQDNAITTVSDVEALQTGMNVHLRSIASGGFITYADVQTDQFHATTTYGNNGGTVYRWTFTAEESMFNSVFLSGYYVISNANFFLNKIENIDVATLGEDADRVVNATKGLAFFNRAYAMNMLAERFCPAYVDDETAKNSLGLSIVRTYSPTSDPTSYPGRSDLYTTYQAILEDIDSAAVYITTTGTPDSPQVTADAIKGLRTRVLLNMFKYEEAAELASELIGLNRYNLISDADEYASMWVNDDGRESIMQFTASMTNNELPASNSFNYLMFDKATGQYTSYYLPESGILSLYDKTNDIRYGAYFGDYTVSINGSRDVVACHKYMGNPSLYNPSGNSNYINKPKLFRIAEMYLIAAEGYAMSGNEGLANQYLNDLRSKRITGYSTQTYSGEELINEIRVERLKELFAEGFRLNDLKRWNMQMARTAPQNAQCVDQGSDLVIPAGDHWFVWAIPQAEIDANPQYKGQQNTGY